VFATREGLGYSLVLGLVRATVLGRVPELLPLRNWYAAGFFRKYDQWNVKLNARWSELMVAEEAATLEAKVKLAWPVAVVWCLKQIHDAGIHWLAGVMAFHVAFANMVAGAILIWHALMASSTPLLTEEWIPLNVYSVLLIAFVLSLVFFLFGPRVVAASVMILGFLLAYVVAAPYVLIWILASQQVLGILVIQFYFVRPEGKGNGQANAQVA
jgi:hypothetical protein